jgi:simple sugar transport system permease protein
MRLLQKNIVPIVFIVLCTIGFHYSGLSWMFFANDLMTRLARNSFLVISLIIPVLAGMGLNFGIVLGAMAGSSPPSSR